MRNGALLTRAIARGFDVFVTADRNLEYQQNISGASLSVIVLVSRSNRLNDLVALVPPLLMAVQDVRPGEVRQVGTP